MPPLCRVLLPKLALVPSLRGTDRNDRDFGTRGHTLHVEICSGAKKGCGLQGLCRSQPSSTLGISVFYARFSTCEIDDRDSMALSRQFGQRAAAAVSGSSGWAPTHTMFKQRRSTPTKDVVNSSKLLTLSRGTIDALAIELPCRRARRSLLQESLDALSRFLF